ncbi:CMGC/CLK protein kinase [Fusarium oxysporum f. sp. raphani 54005]|uniref:CMGC/CLK protein kinase n=1 Tax=Fusarium oxysporum f. sp. raphani 54005 TaxID=1089458 RepID=X0BLT2_FUSOX|nr:CMGC/CLK protein kinase [Fusarium oxysporum f. sp. raphani 54005]
MESLSSTGRAERSITKPSRQIVPATLPLADTAIERAREGQEDHSSTRTDLAVSKVVVDTLPSNIQDKVTAATIEPMCMRQYVPDDAYNRDVGRPRVRKKKIPRAPRNRAREVSVRFVPDARYNKEDGSYNWDINAEFTEEFKILGCLGEGGYGTVVKASRVSKSEDEASRVPKSEDVAIKISALGKECSDAARKELRILETLKMNDEKNQNRCTRAQDWFEYRGHVCLVLDLHGKNTYKFLQENKYLPYPNSQIQSFARQLFTAVAFLHDLGIVHADIKPDNLVLCDDAYRILSYNGEKPSSCHVRSVEARSAERNVLKNTEVRLIDFGLSTFIDEPPLYFCSTPEFSAPETWLCQEASFSHDIWSIGCCLIEFFTGDVLFNTDDMTEYLAMTEAITGLKLEDEISWITDAKFRGILSALLPNAMQEPRKKIRRMKMKHIDQIIIPRDDTFLRNFLDLLKRIFVLNPNHRITAQQALQHPCLTEIVLPDDGTLAAESSFA